MDEKTQDTVAILVTAVAISVLRGWATMILWNAAMPALGLPELGFFQSLCLLWLAETLFIREKA